MSGQGSSRKAEEKKVLFERYLSMFSVLFPHITNKTLKKEYGKFMCCPDCSDNVYDHAACSKCKLPVCEKKGNMSVCVDCNEPYCKNDVITCPLCKQKFCEEHLRKCSICGTSICEKNCSVKCDDCKKTYCVNCNTKHIFCNECKQCCTDKIKIFKCNCNHCNSVRCQCIMDNYFYNGNCCTKCYSVESYNIKCRKTVHMPPYKCYKCNCWICYVCAGELDHALCKKCSMS